MKIRLSESAALSFALMAVSARVFYSLAIDMPEMCNSGWLAALLGGVLTLPLAWAAALLRGNCAVSPAKTLQEKGYGALWRILAVILAAAAAFDGAFVTSAIAGSASYIALNSISLFYLLLPQLALVGWCLMRSGDAIGAGAGVWNRILFCLIVIVVALQLTEYRPLWLTPILGPGTAKLLDGAVKLSGWYASLAGVYLIAEREEESPRPMRPVRLLVLCAAISAALGVFRSMMSPPLVDGDFHARYFQLDMLLSNGRSPLSLQLPLMVLWFISLFFLLLFDAFMCAAMVQQAFPGLRKAACVIIAIGAILAFILCGLTARTVSLSASWILYTVQSAVLALAMTVGMRGRGRGYA